MTQETYKAWSLLLRIHDRCRSAEGRMILHALMVRVIEDGWKEKIRKAIEKGVQRSI